MLDASIEFLIETLGQNLQRVGLSTLNDILNVVAPPISEHEVIQVWLSHDMQGYDCVEPVVYRAFAKVRVFGFPNRNRAQRKLGHGTDRGRRSRCEQGKRIETQGKRSVRPESSFERSE